MKKENDQPVNIDVDYISNKLEELENKINKLEFDLRNKYIPTKGWSS